MILALVLDGVVDSLAAANDEDDAHMLADHWQAVVDITDMNPRPAVGWVLIGNKLFPPAGPATPSIKISRLAFRNRFTSAEKVALYTAATSVAQIRVWLDDLAASTYVDLNRADTIASVNGLVAAGLLTAPRAIAILTDPVTSLEIYLGTQ